MGNTAEGMVSSWLSAIELYYTMSIIYVTACWETINLHKSEVGYNRGQVERKPGTADSLRRPDQREPPEAMVLQSLQDFAKVEMSFARPRRVCWKPGLEESLFPVGEP